MKGYLLLKKIFNSFYSLLNTNDHFKVLIIFRGDRTRKLLVPVIKYSQLTISTPTSHCSNCIQMDAKNHQETLESMFSMYVVI